MWSGPCQQLALATVLDAPHGPRPTHEHVRKTSPVHLPCICRYRHLSHLCTVGIAHRVRARTVVESYRGARGAAIARWTREIYRPRYGYLSRYAVASTRRVAASTPTGGSGCGVAVGGRRSRVGQPGTRKRSTCFSHTYHTQKSEPATSGNRAPSPCSRRYPLVCEVRRAPSARNHQSPEELRVPARGYR